MRMEVTGVIICENLVRAYLGVDLVTRGDFPLGYFNRHKIKYNNET